MTIREIEPELRKKYIMMKYRDDIERIADKVFRLWVKETIPLMMEIVKNEELGFLETKALLDTVLLETIRGLIEKHRETEDRATTNYYLENGGELDG